ncbi:MAG: helix-turn-helix domain-containing protein [Ruminococcus sp.]
MADIICHDYILTGYPDVLTVKDVQDILHLGRNSVYKMLENGEIKTIRAGKKYIIPKIYLVQFILKCN